METIETYQRLMDDITSVLYHTYCCQRAGACDDCRYAYCPPKRGLYSCRANKIFALLLNTRDIIKERLQL